MLQRSPLQGNACKEAHGNVFRQSHDVQDHKRVPVNRAQIAKIIKTLKRSQDTNEISHFSLKDGKLGVIVNTCAVASEEDQADQIARVPFHKLLGNAEEYASPSLKICRNVYQNDECIELNRRYPAGLSSTDLALTPSARLNFEATDQR